MRIHGEEKKARQAIALGEIFIIVTATIAFAFILGSSFGVVSAATKRITKPSEVAGAGIEDIVTVNRILYKKTASNEWKPIDDKSAAILTDFGVQQSLAPSVPASIPKLADSQRGGDTSNSPTPIKTVTKPAAAEKRIDLQGSPAVIERTTTDSKGTSTTKKFTLSNLVDIAGNANSLGIFKNEKGEEERVEVSDDMKKKFISGGTHWTGQTEQQLKDNGWGDFNYPSAGLGEGKAVSPKPGEKLLINSNDPNQLVLVKDGEYKAGFEYKKNADQGRGAWVQTSGEKPGETNKIAGKTAGGHLTEALTWAGLFAGIVQGLRAADILNKNTANAITLAGITGIIVWKGLVAIDAAREKGPTWASKYGGLIGLGAALIVFWLMYKKSEKRIVKFECLPYEPPLGGSQCETCNKDSFRPCSEYRCRALGQGCELLNPGTGKELCTWVSKFDVKSATIETSKSALSPDDLAYIPDNTLRPPMRGVKIVRNNGCLQAFTPLEFGIKTNEPTRCKIDYNHTNSYGDMEFLFGGENYYAYNHTQKMKLPGVSNLVNGTAVPELKNDGTYSLYVRCQDRNGNQNVDEFVFSFCVDPSEDTTPPYIEKASIISGSPVRYKVDSVPIEVYVDEPADCKWSRNDKPYEDMENNMSCARDVSEINNELLYTCNGNLTGIKDREDNKFFFRCKDNPTKSENQRNVMVQSWPNGGFILKGSQPLNIIRVGPNGTIFGSTSTVTVDLEAETSNGAQSGKAICYFSTTGRNDSYIQMYESDSYAHRQSLDFTSGTYTYYFKCNDAGGNFDVNVTTFKVEVDKQAPRVTRVYKEVPDVLKVVTDESAECAYSIASCNFAINDSTNKLIYSNPSIRNVLFGEWKPNSVYYIKCRDFYGNEPNPNECSIIASAMNLVSTEKA